MSSRCTCLPPHTLPHICHETVPAAGIVKTKNKAAHSRTSDTIISTPYLVKAFKHEAHLHWLCSPVWSIIIAQVVHWTAPRTRNTATLQDKEYCNDCCYNGNSGTCTDRTLLCSVMTTIEYSIQAVNSTALKFKR